MEEFLVKANNSNFHILAMIGSLIALRSKLSCPEALKKKKKRGYLIVDYVLHEGMACP